MTDEKVTVDTEYGQLTIPKRLLELWDTYGWPTDEVLKSMRLIEELGGSTGAP